ncbi:MAG: HD domain-containing protein [Opitutales bacterium]|nr:HD domain-containing protein [Opitutales bacterium]
MKISDAKNLGRGESFETVAVLKEIQSKTAKNGGEFLVADFGDKSGSITFMVFSDNAFFGVVKSSKAGDIFRISGRADFYNDKFSPRLEYVEKLDKDEVKPFAKDLCPVSDKDPEQMKAELFALIDTISEEPLKNTVLSVFAEPVVAENFFTSTAAKSMHHAYVHGLLEHTLSCAKTANALFDLYPFIDRNMALAGVILHDTGKVIEYAQDLTFNKTRSGLLEGHLVLSYRFVRKAAIKCGLDDDSRERLEHIMLSHHGEIEWGAVVLPATPEAVFVSCVDYLDAKMGAVYGILKNEGKSEFSEPNFALSKARLLTKKRDAKKTGE